MRIRFKPWARPELEACKFYIDNPQNYKGKWTKLFDNDNPIYLELGCGKGSFIAKMAVSHPNINFIAIDVVDAMLGLAKRNIESIYLENNVEISNVYLTRFDIERILMILDEKDKIDRIYINFCNPWPRGKHRKKRLTHINQLEKYKVFLKNNGAIYFKTDDDGLFKDTIGYLKNMNFEITKITYNLESEDIFGENIETEHERMFKKQQIKIKALIAEKKD